MRIEMPQRGEAEEQLSTPNKDIAETLGKLESLIADFETRMVAEHKRLYPNAFWVNPHNNEEEGPVTKVEQMDEDHRSDVLTHMMRSGVDVLGDMGAGPVLSAIEELSAQLVKRQKSLDEQRATRAQEGHTPDTALPEEEKRDAGQLSHNEEGHWTEAEIEEEEKQLAVYAEEVNKLQERWHAIVGPAAFEKA